MGGVRETINVPDGTSFFERIELKSDLLLRIEERFGLMQTSTLRGKKTTTLF